MINNNSLKDLIIKASTKKVMHIECKDNISDEVLKLFEEKYASLGIVFREDMLYEKLNGKEYLMLFASMSKNKERLDQAIQVMHLNDCIHTAIHKLSYSQKRRIAIAREIIKDNEIIYIQEPLLNLDEDSTHYILKWLEEYLPVNQQIVTSSISLKLLYLMSGSHYYVDEYGVQPLSILNETAESKDNTVSDLNEIKIEELFFRQDEENDSQTKSETVHKVKLVDKISAHLEDKVLLFNPNEIDYLESLDGKIHVNVRGNAFPTRHKMDDLEKDLLRYGFFRCHRSYLVNMQKVQEVIRWTRNSYSLKLEGLEESNIPLSKGRIEELRAIYKF